MDVTNVRIGRACNSSSTHSLLILAPNQATPADDPLYSDHYGWENFTLSSDDEKRKYLGAMLTKEMERNFGPQVGELVMKEIFDVSPNDMDVDHQSQIKFPCAYNTTIPDVDFIQEFVDHVMNDQVVILGGNDNSDGHPLAANADGMGEFDGAGSYVHCRKDATGAWTLFNRKSGSKTRVNFINSQGVAKLGAPELVDIKLTDYCPYGCTYCYMGSTKSGDHSPNRYHYYLAEALGELQVFEVAFGGGEPTLHPEVSTILSRYRKQGIAVGLTTKNYQWAIDHKDEYDAVAFSVDSLAGLTSLLQVNEKIGGPKWDPDSANLTAHVVDGVMPWIETLDVILTCVKERIPVTILGMKRTGRGGGFQRLYEPNKQLVEVATENQWLVRVDTAFIAEYEDEIKAVGVSPKSYTKNEGESSCYIDAVKQFIGPSSYSEMHKMISLGDPTKESVATAFSAF